MLSLFFLTFCVANAFVIMWSLLKDDQFEFQGQIRDKKFSLAKKTPSKNEID